MGSFDQISLVFVCLTYPLINYAHLKLLKTVVIRGKNPYLAGFDHLQSCLDYVDEDLLQSD